MMRLEWYCANLRRKSIFYCVKNNDRKNCEVVIMDRLMYPVP